MTELPRVTVAQRDGLWVITCNRCDFVFRHIYRHVADDQAIQHRSKSHTKGRSWT